MIRSLESLTLNETLMHRKYVVAPKRLTLIDPAHEARISIDRFSKNSPQYRRHYELAMLGDL